MTEMKEFEVFNEASHAVVFKHVGRNFPGLLTQGDTLKAFLDDMKELHKEVENSDLESIKEIFENVQEKLVDLLSHYEKVLETHGHELPYIDSVRTV